MGVRLTDSKAVALYDSTTGSAFGAVFEGTDDFSAQDEAEAFLTWTEYEKGIRDIRNPGPYEMFTILRDWHALLESHDEKVCPWDRDRDSYGVGFLGDDHACPCACHKREGGVFHPATRR